MGDTTDHRTDRIGPWAEDNASQQIAAMGVGDRQQIAARPGAGAEPTLEIDAPVVAG